MCEYKLLLTRHVKSQVLISDRRRFSLFQSTFNSVMFCYTYRPISIRTWCATWWDKPVARQIFRGSFMRQALYGVCVFHKGNMSPPHCATCPKLLNFNDAMDYVEAIVWLSYGNMLNMLGVQMNEIPQAYQLTSVLFSFHCLTAA